MGKEMTRYARVREVLSKEIADGTFSIGSRFPTDQELCERFSVSRHTVREALRHLQQEGLLERQRGAGTVVKAPPVAPYTQRVSSLRELDSYWQQARFECRSENVIVMRKVLADQLGCAVGSRWLRFAGLRYVEDDDDPLCWTEIFLTESLISHRDAIRETDGPFFERVRKLRGVRADEVEQQVSAIAVSQEHAELLNCLPETPALFVRRQYSSDGQEPFEISISIHPADRYIQTTRLVRSAMRSTPEHGDQR